MCIVCRLLEGEILAEKEVCMAVGAFLRYLQSLQLQGHFWEFEPSLIYATALPAASCSSKDISKGNRASELLSVEDYQRKTT